MSRARSQRLAQAIVLTVIAVGFAASSVLRVPWIFFCSRAQQSLTVGSAARCIDANAASKDGKVSGDDKPRG